MHVLMKSQA